MPELPEVECVRRSLEPGLIGRRVIRSTIRRRDIITPRGIIHPLAGGTIQSLDRHGKQLAIVDHLGRAVVVRFGMTGGLMLTGSSRHPTHTHASWLLDSGMRLRFIDARRFGGLVYAPEGPGALWAHLGPDALHIRADVLRRRLDGSRRAIKAALLDQHVLAGVGNIYADEALHAAGLHPARPAGSLGHAESQALAGAIRTILRSAVDAGGSTIRDYRDGAGRAGLFQNRHSVYGRGGLPCLRCGHVLEMGLIAQRTTVWCPVCQPMPGQARSSC